METFPKISFGIPVFNAEKYLDRCLKSIARQDYPQDKFEVLLVDGGSTDGTLKIAKNFAVKIFDNPRKLADYGIKIAIDNAAGELFVVFAADNELVSTDWLITVAKVFARDDELACLWGRMIASVDDAPINRYYELIQNDPLSFFLNKNLEIYKKNSKIERINNRDFYFFRVNKDMPLIWGANGLIYRTSYVKDIILRDEFVADNDVFEIMIESERNKVAYSPGLNVHHRHLTNLSNWIRKWMRNYINHYLKQRQTRNLKWFCATGFNRKLIFWMVYSGVPIFSIVHSIYLASRYKNIYWLYHPLVSFAQMTTYVLATIFTKEGRHMIKEKMLAR